jgi:Phosphotransferase system, mannose/fructose/N-acetylgalactosamine-specific component IIC
MNILQILLLTVWAGLAQVDQMTFNLLPSGIIPTAVFAGIVVGNPELGLLVGGTLQSFALGLGMFGGTSIPNYPMAAIVVTALAGSVSNMETTIGLIGVPVATLTVQIDIFGRFLNTVFQHRADRFAAVGDSKQVYISNNLGVLCWSLSRMIPIFLALQMGPETIENLIKIMPAWLNDGLRISSSLFPAVGFSILLKYLPTKQYFQYLIIGFALVAWFNAPVIAVAAIGLALALIVYQNGLKGATTVAETTSGGDYDE